MSNTALFHDNPRDAVSEVVLTEDYIKTVLMQHEQFRVENALLRAALEQLGVEEVLLFIKEVHILAVENSPAVQAFIAKMGESTEVPELAGVPITEEQFQRQVEGHVDTYVNIPGPVYRTEPDAIPEQGFKDPQDAVEALAQVGRME